MPFSSEIQSLSSCSSFVFSPSSFKAFSIVRLLLLLLHTGLLPNLCSGLPPRSSLQSSVVVSCLTILCSDAFIVLPIVLECAPLAGIIPRLFVRSISVLPSSHIHPSARRIFTMISIIWILNMSPISIPITSLALLCPSTLMPMAGESTGESLPQNRMAIIIALVLGSSFLKRRDLVQRCPSISLTLAVGASMTHSMHIHS